MKKLFSMVFLFTVILFIQNGVVTAEDYSCSYYSNKFLWEVRLKYTVSGDKIEFRSEPRLGLSDDVTSVMDFDVADKYDKLETLDEKEKELVKFIDGKCPSEILICKGYSTVTDTMTEKYAVLFEIQYQTEARNYQGMINDSKINFTGDNECFLIPIHEDDTTGDIVDLLGESCDKYDEYFNNNSEKNLQDLYNKCNDVKNGTKQDCTNYNKYKAEVQSYCNLTAQYGSYVNPCVNKCIKDLNTRLYDIEHNNETLGSCNVSNRIINWIANIMKWVKYIAPVLVIILSMVDFIKAIASNSDEEVKKTQGKFVKRLIAAALLFIIPFIIQFVLETFKLTTDYCGLI